MSSFEATPPEMTNVLMSGTSERAHSHALAHRSSRCWMATYWKDAAMSARTCYKSRENKSIDVMDKQVKRIRSRNTSVGPHVSTISRTGCSHNARPTNPASPDVEDRKGCMVKLRHIVLWHRLWPKESKFKIALASTIVWQYSSILSCGTYN